MEVQTNKLADFRPFKAWRYDTSKVKVKEVLAPPYDVISPSAQEQLYQKSPHNCIRLILNKTEEQDTEGNNRYTRAADFFKSWQEKGVIAQEESPCFYIYRQVFQDPRTGEEKSRSAFLGTLKLEPFENQVVIPHEKTLAKPRADRKKLLEATGTNFSPIFGLFEDSGGELVSMLPDLTVGEPLFEVKDEEDVTHALWAVSDESKISRIRKSLSTQKVYIADGHHRYQTALDYSRDMRRAASGGRDELPSDFVYMALVSFHDPGLSLLPTHRLLTGLEGFDTAHLIKELSEYFDLEKTPLEDIPSAVEEKPSRPLVIGIGFQNEGYLLTLKDEDKARSRMLPDKPAFWYQLDVNVVAYLILKNILGVSETGWESHLKFTHSDEEALKALREGSAQAAFLLKSPQVQVLSEMGKVRELMPQKSTYFHPKLASGLLFYQH